MFFILTAQPILVLFWDNCILIIRAQTKYDEYDKLKSINHFFLFEMSLNVIIRQLVVGFKIIMNVCSTSDFLELLDNLSKMLTLTKEGVKNILISEYFAQQMINPVNWEWIYVDLFTRPKNSIKFETNCTQLLRDNNQPQNKNFQFHEYLIRLLCSSLKLHQIDSDSTYKRECWHFIGLKKCPWNYQSKQSESLFILNPKRYNLPL